MEVLSQSQLRQVLVVVALAVMTSGCGFLSQLRYWSGGSLVDAAYGGLAGQRVAVVCVSDSSSYGAGTEAALLARQVAAMLSEEVKDIEIVPASEIADWIDRKGWDQIDYRQVGEGVQADRVVAIDLSGFRLHQGQTLYKGSANLSVIVFDMNDGGREAFALELPEVTYPKTGVFHASDISESKFRREYLKVLAGQVAKKFYRYDAFDESPLDAAFLGS